MISAITIITDSDVFFWFTFIVFALAGGIVGRRIGGVFGLLAFLLILAGGPLAVIFAEDYFTRPAPLEIAQQLPAKADVAPVPRPVVVTKPTPSPREVVNDIERKYGAR